jgi:hypothetical protein
MAHVVFVWEFGTEDMQALGIEVVRIETIHGSKFKPYEVIKIVD